MDAERISLVEQEALSRLGEQLERVVGEDSRQRVQKQRRRRDFRVGVTALALATVGAVGSYTATTHVLDERAPEPIVLHSKNYPPAKQMKVVTTAKVGQQPSSR